MRTYQEVDVSPVSPSSTTGYEGEWSAFDPLPKLTQASDKDVRIIIGKERESYEPEFNYKGCEKRLEPMPFRTQLQDTRQKDRSKNNHL